MEQKRIIIEGQETPYLIRDNGTVWSEIRNRELKGTLQRNEYHTVYLSFNGKQYNFMLHRLVAEYFCDNPNNYTIVYPSCNYEIATLHFDTVPSYNIGKSFHLKEMNYVGYIVNIKNNKVYVMGDTDVIDEIKDISCDICFVPIGGTYTMNYKEASNYINMINPKEVIPIHYGSIVGNRDLGLKFSELVNSNINVKVFIK